MPIEREIQRKKIFYLATHRGTREADFILGEFVREILEEATPDQLLLIESLLGLSDEVIMNGLFKKELLPDVFEHPLWASLHAFVQTRLLANLQALQDFQIPT